MNPVTPLVRGSVFRRIHLTESRWSSFPSYRPPLMLYSWAYSSDSPSGAPCCHPAVKGKRHTSGSICCFKKSQVHQQSIQGGFGTYGRPQAHVVRRRGRRSRGAKRRERSEPRPTPKGEGGTNRPPQEREVSGEGGVQGGRTKLPTLATYHHTPHIPYYNWSFFSSTDPLFRPQDPFLDPPDPVLDLPRPI